jgi:hypothetical protein
VQYADECLQSLIQQEAEAKGKLAKLASLIDAASSINQQVRTLFIFGVVM